jgi:hypothetical protein
VRRFLTLGLLGYALTGGAIAAPTGVDRHLCPFALRVTALPGRITLRNLATGRTAVLARSRRIWLAPATGVPFLSTSRAGGDPRVVDPCALVAPGPPRRTPRAAAAPWRLPPFPLSRMAFAGLVPVTGTLVRHDHVHLDVVVDGRRLTVPAGLGQAEPVDRGPGPCPPPPERRSIGDCAPGHYFTPDVAVSPLHTHSSSGIVHIESDRPAVFTLGQLFDEWDVRLDARCVGAYCDGRGKKLRVFVGGRRVSGDPRRLVLADRQEIAVVYGRPSAFRVVPSTYRKRWPVGCGGPAEPACIS